MRESCVERGPMPQHAVAAGFALCGACSGRSAPGWCTREIKPEKVWSQNDGGRKIADFGMVRLSPMQDHVPPAWILGTAAYSNRSRSARRCGPTQAMCTPVRIMAYELLTGAHSVHRGDSALGSISADRQHVRPRAGDRRVPPAVLRELGAARHAAKLTIDTPTPIHGAPKRRDRRRTWPALVPGARPAQLGAANVGRAAPQPHAGPARNHRQPRQSAAVPAPRTDSTTREITRERTGPSRRRRRGRRIFTVSQDIRC